MLDKLLQKVSFNSGVISQISFYSNRMRQETKIRRLGLVFILLAFFVQFFAFISPPQSTLASSPNDLINGGFNSAAEAAKYCNLNTEGYATLLANYSIDCQEVATAPTITLNSTNYNRQLFSMGRLPYGLAGETPVTINNVTFYFRYLWSWDTAGSSDYQALKVTSSDNHTYFLLYNCGNIVSIGLPKGPNLTISKTTTPGYPTAGSILVPNQVISYRIIFNNVGTDAKNVRISDPLPAYTTLIGFKSSGANNYPLNLDTNQPTWTYTTVSSRDKYYIDLKLKINSNTPTNTRICNTASISSSGTNTRNSNQVCMTVRYSPTPNTPNTPPVTPVTPVQPTPPSVPSCQYNPNILSTSSQCVPCQNNVDSQNALACIEVSKTAANLTQGISNANGTTAQAGDNIIYTLYATNSGQATVNNYIFSENLSDVLDYSNIVNLYGGNIDNSNQITWPSVNIPPGQTAFEKVEVKVMSPIPQTPTSSSDPGYYNLEMINVYGNTVTIHLPPTVIKSIENITTSTTNLVNTGPGTNIFITALVLSVIGYFFFRSRLLAKESALIIGQLGE